MRQTGPYGPASSPATSERGHPSGSMAERTYYQILGVRQDAPPDVIDAAYRRLKRIYTRSHTQSPWIDMGPDPVDPELAALEQAYRVLRDPVRRSTYDLELATRQQSLSDTGSAHEDPGPQRLPGEPEGAWLAHQDHQENWIEFRIGWAADFDQVVRTLEQSIPEDQRSYDPHTHTWRVAAQHEAILRRLFTNYRPPDYTPPPPPPTPVYPRWQGRPSVHRSWQPWHGWPYLLLGLLVLAIALTWLFPDHQEPPVDLEATATAVAIIEILAATEGQAPTPTPLPTPWIILTARPAYPTVNLRAGPGTDYPSLGFLYAEQEYQVIGSTVDRSWVVVWTGEQTGWAAEWTLEIEGDLEGLRTYNAGSTLPQVVPTPTPRIVRFP